MRPAWTARSTLVVFAYLALAAQLPLVVDIYAYGGVPRLLFVPSYLLLALVYAAVDPLEPFLGGARRAVLAGGPLVAYYLAAVAVTWLGRRVAAARRSLRDD